MAETQKTGRPSKFPEGYEAAIKKLVLMGATDNDLAEAFEVHPDTVQNWKKQRPSFFESLKDWKKEADLKVEQALYKRATGITVEEARPDGITVKQLPPDPTSMIFWLKNRQPDQWRDKPEQKGEGDSLADALNNLADKLPG